jgi:hypothetical protein
MLSSSDCPKASRIKSVFPDVAALKYSFDKFSDIVYGYPVKVETDCQALRDVLMSDKLSATHARWRDGVLAHNIVDVKHIPGITNIADGLSRQYEGLEKAPGDGSEWTVNPDWEERAGLVFDIHQVEVQPSIDVSALKTRFKDEPLYLNVIDALEGLASNASIHEKARARHRASQFMIEHGKLWFVGGGTKARARARLECVTQKEVVELAKTSALKSGPVRFLAQIWQDRDRDRSFRIQIWSKTGPDRCRPV